MPENVAIVAIALPMPLPFPDTHHVGTRQATVIVLLATSTPTRPELDKLPLLRWWNECLWRHGGGEIARSLSGTTGSIGARGAQGSEITLRDPVRTRA